MKFFKSPVGTLTLIVILALVYAYFFEFKKGEQEKAAKQESLKLFQAKEDEITKINLKWAAGETVLAKNEQGEWLVQSPIQDVTETAAISTVLKGISDDASEMTITEDANADLSIYGLKEPLGTVSIQKKDGTAQAVRFGQVDALEGRKYAYVENTKKVVLIPGLVQTRFIKTARDFRVKKIMKTPRADIVSFSVRVKDKNTNISITKESGTWAYANQKWDVDSAVIESYLVQLENISAIDFASENKDSPESQSKYSIKQALASVELRTKSGPPEIITFHANKDGKTYVTSSLKKIVYQIPQNIYESNKISQDYFKLRKKSKEEPKAEKAIQLPKAVEKK